MPTSDPQLLSIAQLFRARTGMDLTGGLGEHGRQGIRRAMARIGESDPSAFRERLETDVEALDVLIDELAVGETFFFRQPQHYEIVRDLVLPHVRERREAGGAGLRAWSAGCASGEEIYSVAALLAEAGELGDAHLVATDLSRGALERAREARYREWSLRGPDAARMRAWLTPSGDRFALDRTLRQSVRLFPLNLATDRYPEPLLGLADLDVIFCRNVLIYFEPQAIARVACSLHDSLAKGGWLLTGASDPPLPERCGLEPVVTHGVVVYRRPLEARAVARREPSAPPPITSPPPRRSSSTPPRRSARPRPTAPRVAASTLDEARALADSDPKRALELCGRELQKSPLSAELHYLAGVLHLGMGDGPSAESALKRASYLDPTLAIVHFVLGTVLRNRGDVAGARTAFRNAQREAERMPEESVVPLAGGETARALVRSAARQLGELGRAEAGGR